METEHKNKELNKFNQKRKHNFKPLSASIIASVLLAMNPNYKVLAEDNKENDDLLKIKALHEDYHSLLKNATESETETQEENEEEASEDEAVDLISDNEEIQMIKTNLLLAIEKVESSEYANQLQADNLTVEKLDQIFESLITDLINQEEAEAAKNVDDDLEDSTDLEEPEQEETEDTEEDTTDLEDTEDSEEEASEDSTELEEPEQEETEDAEENSTDLEDTEDSEE